MGLRDWPQSNRTILAVLGGDSMEAAGLAGVSDGLTDLQGVWSAVVGVVRHGEEGGGVSVEGGEVSLLSSWKRNGNV